VLASDSRRAARESWQRPVPQQTSCARRSPAGRPARPGLGDACGQGDAGGSRGGCGVGSAAGGPVPRRGAQRGEERAGGHGGRGVGGSVAPGGAGHPPSLPPGSKGLASSRLSILSCLWLSPQGPSPQGPSPQGVDGENGAVFSPVGPGDRAELWDCVL